MDIQFVNFGSYWTLRNFSNRLYMVKPTIWESVLMKQQLSKIKNCPKRYLSQRKARRGFLSIEFRHTSFTKSLQAWKQKDDAKYVLYRTIYANTRKLSPRAKAHASWKVRALPKTTEPSVVVYRYSAHFAYILTVNPQSKGG